MNIIVPITSFFRKLGIVLWFYCLINNSYLNESNIIINYSIINDSEEIKVNKSFDIDINYDNLMYINFSQDQLKKNVFDNYIDEISYDFGRCRYIFWQE